MPPSGEPWWVTGTQSTCWNFSWPDHCYSFDYFWPFFQLKWGNKHFHFSSGWWAKFVSGAESVLLVEQSKCSIGKLWVRFLFLYLCFTLSLFVFHSQLMREQNVIVMHKMSKPWNSSSSSSVIMGAFMKYIFIITWNLSKLSPSPHFQLGAFFRVALCDRKSSKVFIKLPIMLCDEETLLN